MDNRMIYAVIVGAVLFAVGIALRVLANQEGLQLILFFITPFIIGVVATGVKRGFLLAFVLSIFYGIANIAIVSPENFRAVFADINVALTVILLLIILPSLIGGALSAVGGLLGKRMFKK